MPETIIKLQCIQCGRTFDRKLKRENTRIKQHKKGPFCSVACSSKGTSRFQKGSAHSNSILTEDNVKMIRTSYKNGIPVRQLMKTTGMAESTIRGIVLRKSWRHV